MFPHTKFLKKSLSRVPLRLFSTPQRLGPEYERREFDAYKYEYEKTQSHLGYSLEELFGKRYGLKHSEVIKKEMRKDTYVLLFAALLCTVFVAQSRNSRYEENVAFKIVSVFIFFLYILFKWKPLIFACLQIRINNYVHRNMHTVREIPDHARPKGYQEWKF